MYRTLKFNRIHFVICVCFDLFQNWLFVSSEMGLDFGVSVLLKTDVPMFSAGEPVYQDISPQTVESRANASSSSSTPLQADSIVQVHPNASVAYVWDIMTHMTNLGCTAPKDEMIEEHHQAFRVRANRNETISPRAFTARDLYAQLANDVLDLVTNFSLPLETTMVLCFDKGDIVVKAKQAVQTIRNQKRDLPPYSLQGIAEEKAMTYDCDGEGVPPGVCIVDKGLDLGDGQGPRQIVSTRLMQTRSLRKMWYAYLAEKFAADIRFLEIRLILDFDSAHAHEITHGNLRLNRAQAMPAGEGEVSAIGWALRLANTHRVQVRSGDSDLIALGLLHYDRFPFHPLMVVIHRPRNVKNKQRSDGYLTLNTRAFACRLIRNGWTVMGFYLGLVANGTDFLPRALYLAGVRKNAVMHGCREYVDQCVAHVDPSLRGGANGRRFHAALRNQFMTDIQTKGSFETLVYRIMTWHYRHPRVTLWKGALCPDFGTSIECKTPAELQHLATKRVCVPTLVQLETARQHIIPNLIYWETLQANLEAIVTATSVALEKEMGLLTSREYDVGDKRMLPCTQTPWMPPLADSTKRKSNETRDLLYVCDIGLARFTNNSACK
jgi:hypothetical protein